MRKHVLNLETREHGDYKSNAIIFRIAGSENSAGYGFGGWDASGSGRIIFGGPIVQGHHAFLFGLASVIDNHGGTCREHREAEADGRLFNAESGDVVSINGAEYALSLCSRGYPKLSLMCRVCETEPAERDTGICRWESCERTDDEAREDFEANDRSDAVSRDAVIEYGDPDFDHYIADGDVSHD